MAELYLMLMNSSYDLFVKLPENGILTEQPGLQQNKKITLMVCPWKENVYKQIKNLLPRSEI